MTRIAHLSDLHLLEDSVLARRGREGLQVRYLSALRRIDPIDRRARAERALARALRAGFDHLVLTGDLTEDGAVGQFEVLRDLLLHAGIPPAAVTLVPGNHDTLGCGWEAALRGPLDPWRATSTPGAVARLRGASVIAVCSAVPQHFTRSSGRVGAAQLGGVAAAVAACDGVAVIAQHHPPFRVVGQWLHGLLDVDDVTALLQDQPRASVLHGHIHRRRDHALARGGRARVFSPTAVAECEAALRLYDVDGDELRPVA